jgi:hypothetical protein
MPATPDGQGLYENMERSEKRNPARCYEATILFYEGVVALFICLRQLDY